MKTPNPSTANRQPTPAENAMKQTSKMDAESGDVADVDKADTPRQHPVRPGDAGIGQSDNQGSSPYQDRERPEEAERDNK